LQGRAALRRPQAAATTTHGRPEHRRSPDLLCSCQEHSRCP